MRRQSALNPEHRILDSGTGPHFIGIGAPRCGTTWTFKMLRLHPEIWIPWKEMHFFDSIDPETNSGYDIRSKLFRIRNGWRYLLRRLIIRSVPGGGAFMRRYFPLKAVQGTGYRWAARYLFGRVSMEWYRALFRKGRQAGFRCGEITPAYCMLSERAIVMMANALPEVRVFLLLRNPVDWAWSDICKQLRGSGVSARDLTDEELIARCPVPTGRSRADFGANLERWLEFFPRDRLMVAFHDEIQNAPADFLDRLCAFIGAGSAPAALKAHVESRVNSSSAGLRMPNAVRRFAAQNFLGEARKMASLAGGPANRWLIEIESVLDGKDETHVRSG